MDGKGRTHVILAGTITFEVLRISGPYRGIRTTRKAGSSCVSIIIAEATTLEGVNGLWLFHHLSSKTSIWIFLGGRVETEVIIKFSGQTG